MPLVNNESLVSYPSTRQLDALHKQFRSKASENLSELSWYVLAVCYDL